MVENAAQLTEVRDQCRWPPAGRRGVGFSRANLFGKHFDVYREEAQAPLLVAMIEHVRAVENLDSILKVNGLDAVLVGPYDLSASMELAARFEEPSFVEVLQRIRSVARHHGVPSGIHVVTPDRAVLQQRLAEGYRFVAWSIDAVFLNVAATRPDIGSQGA
jgi:2-dehydro-3-deoxyglucarate aldolase